MFPSSLSSRCSLLRSCVSFLSIILSSSAEKLCFPTVSQPQLCRPPSVSLSAEKLCFLPLSHPVVLSQLNATYVSLLSLNLPARYVCCPPLPPLQAPLRDLMLAEYTEKPSSVVRIPEEAQKARRCVQVLCVTRSVGASSQRMVVL